ncbi:hypothetical protein CJF30_00010697 [Rutstroemia sp. NJR-2017a BBW]|nr:hypothetical protein CJF30_00010697 [Rutstroemia sp. NJR-2017a BBW]
MYLRCTLMGFERSCFFLKNVLRRNLSLVKPVFALGLHKKDIALLQEIQYTLGVLLIRYE